MGRGRRRRDCGGEEEEGGEDGEEGAEAEEGDCEGCWRGVAGLREGRRTRSRRLGRFRSLISVFGLRSIM
jgi:hypothetical protein